MKLTALILLTACLTVGAKGKTQNITLAVKDAPLEKVFAQIKKQSAYSFVYYKDDLVNLRKVTIQVTNANIEEVLQLLFKDQPLTYTIVDKNIVIKQRVARSSEDNEATKQTQPAVEIDIKGRVTNEDGEPVAASIIVKGTTLGTTTSPSGEFTLTGISESATLLISAISIIPFEVKAATIATLMSTNGGIAPLTAKIKISSLNEVIVRKGYYDEKRGTTTGNVSSITSKDIEKQPVNNPLLAMQGRIPGMVITQVNGLPGSGIQVQIRGVNSLANGNLPLYIIDGIPYTSENLRNLGVGILGTSSNDGSKGGNPLAYVNPQDIESIDVLKDADATAIYGSRGANGVVLITTKKGKAGKLRIDANLQMGFGKVGKELELLNTRQYLEMRKEAFRNDGTAPNPAADYDLTFWDTTKYTDWQKELIGGTAKYDNIQLSLSGGSSNTSYLLSGSYRKQTTVFPGNFSDKQGNLHFNLNSSSLNQKFRLVLSSTFNIDDNNLPKNDFTSKALTIAPNAPSLYNNDGTINWAPLTSGRASWANPIATYINSKFKSNSSNFLANVILSYEIIKGLEIKSSFGYNLLQTDQLTTDPASGKDPSQWSLFGTSLRTSSFLNNKIASWIFEPQVSYNRNIGLGTFSMLLGGTMQQNKSNDQIINASGFSTDLLIEDPSSAGSLLSGFSLNSVYKYMAFFGRLGYNVKDKYLVNITARRDGSSRFGPANRFHNFGAAGVGWVFSKESFLKNINFLSFGKLRASYGTTGSDAIGDYSFLDLYNSVSAGVPYQGLVGLQLSRLFTPDLAWEETKKAEIGLELGFLKDRINFTASYYQNKSSNQLISYGLPYTAGFITMSRNLDADLQNKGWEFTLNTDNISSGNFKWSTSFNIFWNRNKLVKIDPLTSYKRFIGQPFNSFYVYKYGGVDPATGIYQFIDYKGNIVSTPNANTDKTVLISPYPKFSGGFLNTLQYKDFQLDLFFQFVKQVGQNFLSNSVAGRFSGTNWGNQPVSILDRWQKPGDITNIQRLNQSQSLFNSYDNVTNSDLVYSDISFIKLRNVSISYQLPDRWKRLAGLQSCQLYVQCQNLLTFTKYKGFDPETKSVTSLPPLRIITAGVKIGFK